MTSPSRTPWPGLPPADALRSPGEHLVARAAAILADERAAAAARPGVPAATPASGLPGPAGDGGALAGVDVAALQRRVQEGVGALVDGLVALVGARAGLPLAGLPLAGLPLAGLPPGGAPLAPAAGADAPDGAPDDVPTLRAPGVTAPGGVARLAIGLANDDPAAPADLAFATTELIGETGARIPAAGVTVTPAALTIPPGGAATVAVAVRVPRDAAAGTYVGLVVATAAAGPRAAILVRVGAADGGTA